MLRQPCLNQWTLSQEGLAHLVLRTHLDLQLSARSTSADSAQDWARRCLDQLTLSQEGLASACTLTWHIWCFVPIWISSCLLRADSAQDWARRWPPPQGTGFHFGTPSHASALRLIWCVTSVTLNCYFMPRKPT